MDVRILELELLTLRHDLHQLKVANQELAAKHISKDLEIAELIAENTELRNRLYKLEDKLNVNSGNSGLPTSKEIYRAEKHSKPKSGLKPGGQPGHQYKGYEFKMPDAIIDVLPAEKQCVCGGELEPQTEYKAHQK
jgi:transposase